VFIVEPVLAQTTYTRQDNASLLNDSAAWGGTLPTGTDIVKWDATCGANTGTALGGNVTWGQILLTNNVGSAVTIANTDGATLTLNGVSSTGIVMSAANQDLNINNPIILGASQTWNIGASRTMTAAYAIGEAGSGYGITKAGAGTMTLAGTNTYRGATTVSAGTLTINGGQITNSIGAVTINSGGTMVVTNGSTLVTTGATAINGLMKIIGGASPASTWNLATNDLVVSASGSTGTLTVDGNGVAGAAVVTNTRVLYIGSPGSGSGTVVMTNGAQAFVNKVFLGTNVYPNASSNNKLTIVGGAENSVLNVGGGSVTVGFQPHRNTSDNNKLIIDAGGIMTNAGSMWVGYCANRSWNGMNNNQLVVTNGGQLFTSGNSGIGYDLGASSLGSVYNCSATIAGTNSATGAGSLWNLGGGNLNVGYNAGSIPNYSNSLSVSDGGVVTNVNSLALSVGSTVTSNNAVVLRPGGLIFANSATITNRNFLTVGIDITKTPGCGLLTTASNLNISGSTLNFSITGRAVGTFVFAQYGSRTGEFAFTNGLPEGGSVRYDYAGNQIAMIVPALGTVLKLR
jgi:autotransporter-associated beta strand protein